MWPRLAPGARPAALSGAGARVSVHTTACPRNGYSTCSMRVTVEGGRLVRIGGVPENRATPEGPCLEGLAIPLDPLRAGPVLHLPTPNTKNRSGAVSCDNTAMGPAKRGGVWRSVAAAAWLWAAVSAADDQARTYRPGDMVELDGGEVYKIIRCLGETEWDDCEYQAYAGGKPTGNPSRISIRNLRAGEERLRKSRGTSSASPAVAAPRGKLEGTTRAGGPSARSHATPRPVLAGPVAGADGTWKRGDRLEVVQRSFWYPAQIVAVDGQRYKIHYDGYGSEDDEWVDASRMRPIGGHRVTEACAWQPPARSVTARDPFSEALAKRRIFDEYGRSANGTLSAPLRVGVTFLAFEMGSPYVNTVETARGWGAQRRHGGAPTGATVYTFRSKHMVCEQYRDGVMRRLVEGSYACFVDRDGSWTCPSENDTKIVPLDEN